ncbi:MAG: hypothetical protein ABEH43_11415 [Flavobacteriales bacterium]
MNSGLTIKHMMGNEKGLEGIFSIRNDDFWSVIEITGLYEIHEGAFDVDHLYWYYGAGGHIGFWTVNDNDKDLNDDTGLAFGPTGVLGIEYCIQEIPFNISLDFMPNLSIVEFEDIEFDPNAGVSVRYYLQR